MNCDHKPKLGQTDLVTGFIGHHAQKMLILWSIKIGHYRIGDNFVKCEPIYTNFA